MSVLLEQLRAAAEAEFAAQRNQPAPEPEPEETELLNEELGVPLPEETPAEEEPVIEEPAPAPEPAAEPEAPPAAPEPPRQKKNIYTRVIDLGDGTPPQVFKAATKDELIEKIAVAQAHASRRIRELKSQLTAPKPEPEAAPAPKTFTPRTLNGEEEFELSQEIQTKPTEALSKAITALIGATPEEIREALATSRELKQVENIRSVGQQFITAHPEYPISTANEAAMAQYIKKNNLAWTVKNLEIAFADLAEAGFIKVAQTAPEPTIQVIEEEEEPVLATPTPAPSTPAPAPVVQNQPTPPAARVTEEPRRKRPVVGVSTAGSVATDPAKNTPHEVSVEDLLKLSPSERRRIVLQAAGNR